jgi:hypothetical protein
VVDGPEHIETTFKAGSGTPVDLTGKSGPWRLALLPAGARAALTTLTHRKEVSQLGALATVHIGVVTGANRFFILSDSDASENRLPASAVRPILSTSKHFRGLELRTRDFKDLRRANERVLLLETERRKSKRLDTYLASPAAEEAQHAFKCRNRSVWHEVGDTRVPDAFLSYVIDRGPRLVLNRAKALCTNAIHRVWWRERATVRTQESWAVSIASSLGGLSAELYGRGCGGGALKLEPTEAAALWVPNSFRRPAKLAVAFTMVSSALRVGEWERAREIADRAILRDELGLSPTEVTDLRAGHDTLLDQRFAVAARETRRLARSS